MYTVHVPGTLELFSTHSVVGCGDVPLMVIPPQFEKGSWLVMGAAATQEKRFSITIIIHINV